MSYGYEEFNEIVKCVNEGMKIEDISKKVFMSEKSVRNLLKDNGFDFDKKQRIWYNVKNQGEGIFILNNCDVEYEIERLSSKRYYDRYKDPYPSQYIHDTEVVILHKGLYDELEEVTKKLGCDYVDELIELILLRFLEKNKKVDYTEIFRMKAFKELGYDEEELKIIMKFPCDDEGAITEDEMFFEDDENEIANELKKYYKEFFKNNNIDISDINEVMNKENISEFNYLQERYRKLHNKEIIQSCEVMK